MAKELPRLTAPLRVRSFASRPGREKASPRGEHRPECSCRRRSTPATLIGQIAQPVPGSAPHVGLQSLALEAGAAQLERRARLGLDYDAPKPSLHQRTQRDPLTLGNLTSFAKKRIRNFYSRLHDPSVWRERYGCPYHSVLVVDRSTRRTPVNGNCAPRASPASRPPLQAAGAAGRAARRVSGFARSGCPGAFAPSSFAAGGPRRRGRGRRSSSPPPIACRASASDRPYARRRYG